MFIKLVYEREGVIDARWFESEEELTDWSERMGQLGIDFKVIEKKEVSKVGV